MDVSVLELLERALNQTGAVIATISPAEKALPTPCTDWDVESLVNHLLTHDLPNFAMHSWDLAKALGAEIDLDPALAEYSIAWSKRMLKPEYRGAGKAFGAEVPVPLDAPAYGRLAGWFGRDPDFT